MKSRINIPLIFSLLSREELLFLFFLIHVSVVGSASSASAFTAEQNCQDPARPLGHCMADIPFDYLQHTTLPPPQDYDYHTHTGADCVHCPLYPPRVAAAATPAAAAKSTSPLISGDVAPTPFILPGYVNGVFTRNAALSTPTDVNTTAANPHRRAYNTFYSHASAAGASDGGDAPKNLFGLRFQIFAYAPPFAAQQDVYPFRLALKESDIKQNGSGSAVGARVSVIIGPADNFDYSLLFPRYGFDGVRIWAPQVRLDQAPNPQWLFRRNNDNYPRFDLCVRYGTTSIAPNRAGRPVTDRCVPKQCTGLLNPLDDSFTTTTYPSTSTTTTNSSKESLEEDALHLAQYAAGAGTNAFYFYIVLPLTFLGNREAKLAQQLQQELGYLPDGLYVVSQLANDGVPEDQPAIVRDVNYPLYVRAPVNPELFSQIQRLSIGNPGEERCNEDMAYTPRSSNSSGRSPHPLEALHTPPATPPRLSGIIIADRPFVVGPTYSFAALVDASPELVKTFFDQTRETQCSPTYMTNASSFSLTAHGWRGRHVVRPSSPSSTDSEGSRPVWRGPSTDTFFGGRCVIAEVIGNPHGPVPARPFPPPRVDAVLVTATLNISQRMRANHNLVPYIPSGPPVSHSTQDGWWEASVESSGTHPVTGTDDKSYSRDDPSPLPPTAMPTVGESTALMAHCTIATDPTAFLVTLIPPNATGPVHPYFDRSLLAGLPLGADPDALMLLEEYFCVGLDKGVEHMQIACQSAERCVGFTTLVNVDGKEFTMCLLRQPAVGTTAASRVGHTRYAFPRMFYYKQPASARRCSVRAETSGTMAVYLQQSMFGEEHANVLVTVDGREITAYCGHDVGMYGNTAGRTNAFDTYALCASSNKTDSRSFRVQTSSVVTVEVTGSPMRRSSGNDASVYSTTYLAALFEVTSIDATGEPKESPLPAPLELDGHLEKLPARATVLIEETDTVVSVFAHRATHAAILATQSVFDCNANLVESVPDASTICVGEQLRMFTTTLSQAPTHSMYLLDNIPSELVTAPSNTSAASATVPFAATSCQACGGAAGFLGGLPGRSDQCSVEQWCGGPIPLAPAGSVPFSDRCTFSSSSGTASITTPQVGFSTKPGAAVSSINGDLVPSALFSGFLYLRSGVSLNARTKLCSGILGTLALGPGSAAFPLRTTTVFILIPAPAATSALNEGTAIAAAAPFLRVADGSALAPPPAAAYLDPLLSLRVGSPVNRRVPVLVNLTAAGYAPTITAEVFGGATPLSSPLSLVTAASARELASAFRLVKSPTAASGAAPMLEQACLVDNVMSTQHGAATDQNITCTFVLPINTTHFSLDLAQIGFVSAVNDVSITLSVKSDDSAQFGPSSILSSFECGPTHGFGKTDAAFGLCDVYYTCQSRFLFPTADFGRRFYDEARGSLMMQVVLPSAKPNGCAMNVAAIATFSRPDEGPGAPGASKACDAETEFLCAADRRCFPLSAICDGTYDCSDRTDEFLCRAWYPLDANETHATNQYKLFRSDGGHAANLAADPFSAAGDMIRGNTTLQACKREAMRRTLLLLGEPFGGASTKRVDSLLYNSDTQTCWLPNTDTTSNFTSILESARAASTVITTRRIERSFIANRTHLRTYVAVVPTGRDAWSGFSLCENSISCSGNGVLAGNQTVNKTDQAITLGGRGACKCRCHDAYAGGDCSIRKSITFLGDIIAVFEGGSSFAESLLTARVAAAMNAGDAVIQCNGEPLVISRSDVGLRCVVDALSGDAMRSEELRANLLDPDTLAAVNSRLSSNNHPPVAYFTPFGAVNAVHSVVCPPDFSRPGYFCGAALPPGDYQSIRIFTTGFLLPTAAVTVSITAEENETITAANMIATNNTDRGDTNGFTVRRHVVNCSNMISYADNYECRGTVCDVAFPNATATSPTRTYSHNITVNVSEHVYASTESNIRKPFSVFPCPLPNFRIDARPRFGDANTSAQSVLQNDNLDTRIVLVVGIAVFSTFAVLMVGVGAACLVRGCRRLKAEQQAPAATGKEQKLNDDGTIIGAKLALLAHLRFFRSPDLSKPVRTGAKCVVGSLVFLVVAMFLVLVLVTTAGRRSNFMVLYEEYSDKQCKASTVAFLPRRLFAIPSSNLECERMRVVGDAAGMVFAAGRCLEGGRRVLLQIGGSEATCRAMGAVEFPSDACVPVRHIIAGTTRSTYVQLTCTDSAVALDRVYAMGNLTSEAAEVRTNATVQSAPEARLPTISAASMPFVVEGVVRTGITPAVPFTALSEPNASTFDFNTNPHRLVLQTLDTVKAPPSAATAAADALPSTYIPPTAHELQYRGQMARLPLDAMKGLLPADHTASYPVGYLFNNFGHASQKQMKGTTGIRYYGVRRTPFDMGAYINDDMPLTDGVTGFTISMNIRASAASSGFAFAVTDAFESTATSAFYPVKRLEAMIRGTAAWYDSTYHVYSSLFVDGPGNFVIFAFADPKDDPAASDVRRRALGADANVQRIQWDLAKIGQTRLFNGHWHHLAIVFRVENDKPKALLMIDGKTSYSGVGWQQCVERFPTSIARHSAGRTVFVHDADTDRVISGGALVAGLFSGGLHNLRFEPFERLDTSFLVEGTQAMRDLEDFPIDTVRALATILFICAIVAFMGLVASLVPGHLWSAVFSVSLSSSSSAAMAARYNAAERYYDAIAAEHGTANTGGGHALPLASGGGGGDFALLMNAIERTIDEEKSSDPGAHTFGYLPIRFATVQRWSGLTLSELADVWDELSRQFADPLTPLRTMLFHHTKDNVIQHFRRVRAALDGARKMRTEDSDGDDDGWDGTDPAPPSNTMRFTRVPAILLSECDAQEEEDGVKERAGTHHSSTANKNSKVRHRREQVKAGATRNTSLKDSPPPTVAEWNTLVVLDAETNAFAPPSVVTRMRRALGRCASACLGSEPPDDTDRGRELASITLGADLLLRTLPLVAPRADTTTATATVVSPFADDTATTTERSTDSDVPPLPQGTPSLEEQAPAEGTPAADPPAHATRKEEAKSKAARRHHYHLHHHPSTAPATSRVAVLRYMDPFFISRPLVTSEQCAEVLTTLLDSEDAIRLMSAGLIKAHSTSGMKADDTANAETGNTPAAGNASGSVAEVLAPVIVSLQSAHLWATSISLPRSYGQTFNGLFSFLSIDFVAAFDGIPTIAVPLIHLVGGLAAVSFLLYWMLSDNWLFFSSTIRYMMRRDALEKGDSTMPKGASGKKEAAAATSAKNRRSDRRSDTNKGINKNDDADQEAGASQLVNRDGRGAAATGTKEEGDGHIVEADGATRTRNTDTTSNKVVMTRGRTQVERGDAGEEVERDPRVPLVLHEAMRSECRRAPAITVEQLPIEACRHLDLFLGLDTPANADESPAAVRQRGLSVPPQPRQPAPNSPRPPRGPRTSSASGATPPRCPLVAPPPTHEDERDEAADRLGNEQTSATASNVIEVVQLSDSRQRLADPRAAAQWKDLSALTVRTREGHRLVIEREEVSSGFLWCCAGGEESEGGNEDDAAQSRPRQEHKHQQKEGRANSHNFSDNESSDDDDNKSHPTRSTTARDRGRRSPRHDVRHRGDSGGDGRPMRGDATISALEMVCPRHPTTNLVPQTQSKLWPFDNRPACCLADPNGKLCKTDCGSIFVCNKKYRDEHTGEALVCTFAVCERHSRPTVGDAIRNAVIYKFARRIQTNGKEWFLCFVGLIVANVIYMPFLKTAMMIISCHPSYQCEFQQRCWGDPDQKFILAAFLSAVLLLVLGVGYPMMLVGLLDARRRTLRTFFVHEGYQKRYAELTDEDIEQRAEVEERALSLATAAGGGDDDDDSEKVRTADVALTARNQRDKAPPALGGAVPVRTEAEAEAAAFSLSPSTILPPTTAAAAAVKTDTRVAAPTSFDGEAAAGGSVRSQPSTIPDSFNHSVPGGQFNNPPSRSQRSDETANRRGEAGAFADTPTNKNRTQQARGDSTKTTCHQGEEEIASRAVLGSDTVSAAEWSRFAATDTSALATLYNTVHHKWLFLPPILLLLKVMLLVPAVFMESRSVNQRIGTAVVEIVYAMFIFLTETQVSPIVVFSFRFASMHQLLILGLSNLGLVRQHEENRDYATAMVASTGGFLLINVCIVVYTVLHPTLEPILRLRRVISKLASLGFTHSGSVSIYLDPYKYTDAAAEASKVVVIKKAKKEENQRGDDELAKVPTAQENEGEDVAVEAVDATNDNPPRPTSFGNSLNTSNPSTFTAQSVISAEGSSGTGSWRLPQRQDSDDAAAQPNIMSRERQNSRRTCPVVVASSHSMSSSGTVPTTVAAPATAGAARSSSSVKITTTNRNNNITAKHAWLEADGTASEI